MMYPLDVAVTTRGQRVSLTLEGELDLEATETLEAAVRDALARAPKLVCIDLRDVGFIDSTGLRTLITVHDWARQAGLRMEIVRGPEQVQRVLDITGMTDRLPLVDEPSEQA